MQANRITDPQQIRERLDACMMSPDKTTGCLVSICSREHRPAGIIYEGYRPIAACQTDEDRIYTLAGSGSRYRIAAAVLKLSGIVYIQPLG